MSLSSQSDSESGRFARALRNRSTLPSWLLSLVFHLVLMLILGLTLRLSPPQGAVAERTAEVGVVLKHQNDQQQYFEGPDDTAEAQSDAASRADGTEALFSDEPPSDPGSELPSALDVIGPGALQGGGVPTSIGAEAGPRSPARDFGGKARTSVFGVQGEGYKFVYVFDRSGSMGSAGRGGPTPLGAAKAQLLASLRSLEETHQFQIIFFNDKLQKFNPSGDPNRLVWATERNKNLAAKFVGGVTATNTTRHEQALVAAIKLQPDVIFFLTDAGEPIMYPPQLAKIKRMAAGITINAIEFGYLPQADSNNFLVRLARQNGGQYGYVNILERSAQQR